jgi:hypothetical protein
MVVPGALEEWDFPIFVANTAEPGTYKLIATRRFFGPLGEKELTSNQVEVKVVANPDPNATDGLKGMTKVGLPIPKWVPLESTLTSPPSRP